MSPVVIKLLSGNEALALGAYHAGVRVATAYPGTPSTEILANISRFSDVYSEWSTNEKVALEVALGAAYGGARAVVSMKHVGLNVAADPFMAASTTGINAGLVIIVADDPGMHSSQNEQDTRHYAKLAKIPVLEPSDSQECHDFMILAFEISEKFDTPVLIRSTTRISHSKSSVNTTKQRQDKADIGFIRDFRKYVMLPLNARPRHVEVEKRLLEIKSFSETVSVNKVETGSIDLGIISSGIAYQYARQTFPEASFIKLGMPHPIPKKMIADFASQVKSLVVIEELDPFLEENIKAMGIKVTGKDIVPLTGELNPDIVEDCSYAANLIIESTPKKKAAGIADLPGRPPLFCAGCPHAGVFFLLSSIAYRSPLSKKPKSQSSMIITGDIGCYTLSALPPLSAMDTCACMGGGIGQALGLEKAGVNEKIVAVIGDSTFLHSGITPLIDAVYNGGHFLVIILDNMTTAMTGHQDHPGTGKTAQGKTANRVELEKLVRGIGINTVQVIDAFKIKELRKSIRSFLDSGEMSVIIVRGNCQAQVKKKASPMFIDRAKCSKCELCTMIGCPAIQYQGSEILINEDLCVGSYCGICQQICPQHAIQPKPIETQEATK